MMALRTPLSSHALSKVTKGYQGILAMVNFVKFLSKTTDSLYMSFAIQLVLPMPVMDYHFSQTTITIFSIQTPDPKAKATQFRVFLCPLLLGINFCFRQLSWNNKQSPNLSGLQWKHFFFIRINYMLTAVFSCCLALLNFAQGLRLKGSLYVQPAYSHVWRNDHKSL